LSPVSSVQLVTITYACCNGHVRLSKYSTLLNIKLERELVSDLELCCLDQRQRDTYPINEQGSVVEFRDSNWIFLAMAFKSATLNVLMWTIKCDAVET